MRARGVLSTAASSSRTSLGSFSALSAEKRWKSGHLWPRKCGLSETCALALVAHARRGSTNPQVLRHFQRACTASALRSEMAPGLKPTLQAHSFHGPKGPFFHHFFALKREEQTGNVLNRERSTLSPDQPFPSLLQVPAKLFARVANRTCRLGPAAIALLRRWIRR